MSYQTIKTCLNKQTYKRRTILPDTQSLISKLYNQIESIRKGKLREIEDKPGYAKCETIASNIEGLLEQLVDSFESEISDQKEAAEEEEFDLLFAMLNNLVNENKELSKKKPDGILNQFKIAKVNEVLRPLKELLCKEEASKFLVLVHEPEQEDKDSKAKLNTYSDVSIILSQYKAACSEYKRKYYENEWR